MHRTDHNRPTAAESEGGREGGCHKRTEEEEPYCLVYTYELIITSISASSSAAPFTSAAEASESRLHVAYGQAKERAGIIPCGNTKMYAEQRSVGVRCNTLLVERRNAIPLCPFCTHCWLGKILFHPRKVLKSSPTQE